MKVVVTGATGNVGTSVIAALSADPSIDEIVGIARRRLAWAPPKTLFHAADLSKDDLTHLFRDADAVVHLAWLFQPTHKPMVTWRVNAQGSIRVFDAAAAAGVNTIVYASSIGAYSPATSTDPVTEDWPTNSMPTCSYGREKAYVERVLDNFEARHPAIRVVRMRPAFIFKHESATEQRRLFAGPFLPGRILKPGRLPVLVLPTHLAFQALHSSDAAEAYRLAVTSELRGAFNLAAGPIIGANEISEIFGSRTIVVPYGIIRPAVAAAWHMHLTPADPKLLDLFMSLPLLDTTRARDEMKWVPKFTGIDALAEMIQGMAEGAGGKTPPLEADSLRGRIAELTTQ